MDEPCILSLEDATFAYPGRATLFEGLDFQVRAGQRIGLYGPNGSGKTSLFRLLLGLEKPSGGRLLLHGQPVQDEKSLRALRCTVGLVMQNADDQLFSPTVLEEVAFGPLNLGLSRDQAADRAMETLESMHMAGFADRLTHRLSGGEKKLVSIASVLSMRPEVLLLDEPTAFLDQGSRERMIAVLADLTCARVVISHDRDFLQRTVAVFQRLDNGVLGLPEEVPDWPDP